MNDYVRRRGAVINAVKNPCDNSLPGVKEFFARRSFYTLLLEEVPVQVLNTNLSLMRYKPGTYLYKIINKDQLLYSGKFIVQ